MKRGRERRGTCKPQLRGDGADWFVAVAEHGFGAVHGYALDESADGFAGFGAEGADKLAGAGMGQFGEFGDGGGAVAGADALFDDF